MARLERKNRHRKMSRLEFLELELRLGLKLGLRLELELELELELGSELALCD